MLRGSLSSIQMILYFLKLFFSKNVFSKIVVLKNTLAKTLLSNGDFRRFQNDLSFHILFYFSTKISVTKIHFTAKMLTVNPQIRALSYNLCTIFNIFHSINFNEFQNIFQIYLHQKIQKCCEK